ncbi:uncharacterized protein LOC127565072 [Drosophila albomicans]|uniref:Uncharacterized protein LOC127565072 n=1 Tax=Drosophila albomicans TaxID=7291 RepID=A0A9C6SL69_DROAB|nr:uncharacterized protein LOC127565072 [Drosophila albomicans]
MAWGLESVYLRLKKRHPNDQETHMLSNDDLTVVVLESCEGCMLLASCYMAHDVPAPPEELRRLVDMVSSSNKQLIIGTDANAHHSVWGSPDINERGESDLDFILNYKLRLANRGEESTYVGPTSRNVLDFTIATECTNVEEWRVLDRPSFSDHKYTQFTIPLNRVPVAQPIRIPRNTNWVKFSSLVSKSAVHHQLGTAPRNNCQCPQLAKKADNEYVWDEYRSLLKSYKKMIRSSKRFSWRTFCSDLDNIKDTSRLRKLLSKQDTSPNLLKSGDGVWTESSAGTLETLLSTHLPGFIGIENSDWQLFPSLPVMRPPAGLITDNKISTPLRRSGHSVSMDFPQQCCKPASLRLFLGYRESIRRASHGVISPHFGGVRKSFFCPRRANAVMWSQMTSDLSA